MSTEWIQKRSRRNSFIVHLGYRRKKSILMIAEMNIDLFIINMIIEW